ncbi:retrovirus-related pol polyprotein from transposon TNT 1-94 [Tanacetum coccineum]|uniref:Retrovirus-related pol polyprotein from transposon TNT 1-94 n=1 Tax=Tanacetum coccineum TaxID=301880 RepID=A0ABQ5EKT4_9ASTR
MLPLLAYQKLTGYVDGSIPKLSAMITTGDTSSPNPAYVSWIVADQRALILIQSSLSEEAMAKTLGHSTSHDVWSALADIYQHDSLERIHTLKDSLRHLKKGTSTVSEFSRKFKTICSSTVDAHLVEAFQSQCNTSNPDWFADTRASTHMTPSSANLDAVSSCAGNDSVIFGNGNGASISHICRLRISPNISLLDILVNRHSKETLTQGRRRNGLYVLDQGNQAFFAKLSSKRITASFDLWHNRLGHVSHDIISVLNKLGCLSVTSILPTSRLCSSCQLLKRKHLSFDLNLKRSMHVLELVHCDLWGPSPVMSIDGFRYYA